MNKRNKGKLNKSLNTCFQKPRQRPARAFTQRATRCASMLRMCTPSTCAPHPLREAKMVISKFFSMIIDSVVVYTSNNWPYHKHSLPRSVWRARRISSMGTFVKSCACRANNELFGFPEYGGWAAWCTWRSPARSAAPVSACISL